MSHDSTAAPEAAARKLSGRRRKEIVAVLLFSGGPIFESSIPLSVFGIDRQDAGVPRYRLLACAGEEGPLRTTGGLELTAPNGLEAIARAGTVVVPAWRSITAPPPEEALDALRRAHEEGARIVGLCTVRSSSRRRACWTAGPRRHTGCTHRRWPSAIRRSTSTPRTLRGRRRRTDIGGHGGRTSTCPAHRADGPRQRGGRSAGPPTRGPPRRSGGQERYLDRSLPEEIGADPLAEVVAWALEHLHEQFDVETLAARAYMSRRTFDRRFRSLTGSAPLQWLITQRVLQAQRLLETSDYSVDEVAGRCGFRSPVALRGHFRRPAGLVPGRVPRGVPGTQATERAGAGAGRRGQRSPGRPRRHGYADHGRPGTRAPRPGRPRPALHPDGPVPMQSRRTANSVGLAAEHARDPYVGSRASLPGQRSGA